MTPDHSKLPEPLSAKFKNSFAYKTLSYRLPVIITKVIDLLCRQRKQIPIDLGLTKEDLVKAEEETKQLIENLAKLKYELQTNKPIKPIVSELTDTKAWNDYLKEEMKHNQEVIYFNVSWLYSECYFYRMMREVFVKSEFFKDYDQFSSIKQESFRICLQMASTLAAHLKQIENKPKVDLDAVFNFYTMTSLWGNKFDLSISCGKSNDAQSDEYDFRQLDSKILVNEFDKLWSYVKKLKQKHTIRIDVVLDNAGYELFTDLCWIEALHCTDIIPRDKTKVHFYVKKMPWFVSDTMSKDVIWLLKYIDQHGKTELKEINNHFKENFAKRLWVLEEHDFWTLPHDFAKMPDVAPELYKNLCQSNLIIFKGDLNYRKLVGDLQWNFDTTFKASLRGFQPTSAICSLRTIKADVLVGVHDDKILKKIENLPSGWMETGEYAIVNFLNNSINN